MIGNNLLVSLICTSLMPWLLMAVLTSKTTDFNLTKRGLFNALSSRFHPSLGRSTTPKLPLLPRAMVRFIDSNDIGKVAEDRRLAKDISCIPMSVSSLNRISENSRRFRARNGLRLMGSREGASKHRVPELV